MLIPEVPSLKKISHPLWHSTLQELSVVHVTGKDAQRILHSFSSNEVQSLEPGSGCEAFFLNMSGKILSHGIILKTLNPQKNIEWLITGTAGIDERIVSRLSNFIFADDVQFKSLSKGYKSVYFGGELLSDFLHFLLPDLDMKNNQIPLSGLNHFSLEHLFPHSLSYPAFGLFRTDFFEPVVQLIISPDDFSSLMKNFQAKSHHMKGIEITRQEFERFRIASGWLEYNLDITEDNLAQECSRTELAVSFHKGCYVGQETVARIDALGHVNQMMRILSFRTSNPLESIPGQPIPLSDPETQKALGKITSLATCEDGTLIALALIRRHIAVVETSFHAKIAQQEISEFHVHWINRE